MDRERKVAEEHSKRMPAHVNYNEDHGSGEEEICAGGGSFLQRESRGLKKEKRCLVDAQRPCRPWGNPGRSGLP